MASTLLMLLLSRAMAEPDVIVPSTNEDVLTELL